MIKRVINEAELERFVGGGTLITGKFALQQGKPVFVMTRHTATFKMMLIILLVVVR